MLSNGVLESKIFLEKHTPRMLPPLLVRSGDGPTMTCIPWEILMNNWMQINSYHKGAQVLIHWTMSGKDGYHQEPDVQCIKRGRMNHQANEQQASKQASTRLSKIIRGKCLNFEDTMMNIHSRWIRYDSELTPVSMSFLAKEMIAWALAIEKMGIPSTCT